MGQLASALLALVALGAEPDAALAADERPPAGGAAQEESEAVAADAEALADLLDGLAEARRAKQAGAMQAALEACVGFTNEELVEPALAGLKYRPSRDDKRAARDEAAALGDKSPAAVAAQLARVVGEVRIAAARALATHPGDKVGAALLDAFEQKGVTEDMPTAAAVFVHTMGVLGYRDAQGEVAKELARYGHRDVVKACVRYLGQVKTTDMGAARQLCDLLAAPQPADPDSPLNPPASYWEARWKIWMHVRRDASWALREITGQTFQPAESEGEGDRRRALEYLREHARELGLR